MTDGGRGISGDGVPDRGASTTSYRNRPSQRPTRHPSEGYGSTFARFLNDQPVDVLEGGSGESHIGDYDIMRPIGKGKFAIVYRAKRKSDGITVALKKISVHAMDEKARTKCLKEVRLLKSVDHSNIIRYMDSFLEDNELFIVFEWAAAGDLKRQVRKALERGLHLQEGLVWGYFSQICSAIRYMHEKRIMHRDLKPANIFLTLRGKVKVGDLGLGRLMSEDTMEAHSKVGTPLYMSPEVLRGGGYGWKSDVWSLGCILYELAMLRSPFKSEGLNLYSLCQKINNGDYPPLLEYYSNELRSLAHRMISTDPQNRPDIDEVCSIANEMKRKMDLLPDAPAPPETGPHLRLKALPPKTETRGGGINKAGQAVDNPGSAENAATPETPSTAVEKGGAILAPAANETAAAGDNKDQRRQREKEMTFYVQRTVNRGSDGGRGAGRNSDDNSVARKGSEKGVSEASVFNTQLRGQRRRQQQQQQQQQQRRDGGEAGAKSKSWKRASGSISHGSKSSKSGGDSGSGQSGSGGSLRRATRGVETATVVAGQVKAGCEPSSQRRNSPFAFDQSAPMDGSALDRMAGCVGGGREAGGKGSVPCASLVVRRDDETPNMSRANADPRWSRSRAVAANSAVAVVERTTGSNSYLLPEKHRRRPDSNGDVDLASDAAAARNISVLLTAAVEGHDATAGAHNRIAGARLSSGTITPASPTSSYQRNEKLSTETGTAAPAAAAAAATTEAVNGDANGTGSGTASGGGGLCGSTLSTTFPRASCDASRALASANGSGGEGGGGGGATRLRGGPCFRGDVGRVSANAGQAPWVSPLREPSAAAAVVVSGDVLVAVEALSDRLSLLGYAQERRRRNKPPLSRLHFALPGSSGSGWERGKGGSGGRVPLTRRQQFLDFVELSQWFLGLLGGLGTYDWVASDASSLVCGEILQACQGLGFEPRRGATVSPISLAMGYGGAVLEVLTWLAEATLERQANVARSAVISRRLVLPAAEEWSDRNPGARRGNGKAAGGVRSHEAITPGVGDDKHPNIGDEGGAGPRATGDFDKEQEVGGRESPPSSSRSSRPCGDDATTGKKSGKSSSSSFSSSRDLSDGQAASSCLWGKGGASGDGSAAMVSMVEPTVDPLAWRLEQERVAPRLTTARRSDTDSWPHRLHAFRKAAAATTAACGSSASKDTGGNCSACTGLVSENPPGTAQPARAPPAKAIRKRPLATKPTGVSGKSKPAASAIAAAPSRCNPGRLAERKAELARDRAAAGAAAAVGFTTDNAMERHGSGGGRERGGVATSSSAPPGVNGREGAKRASAGERQQRKESNNADGRSRGCSAQEGMRRRSECCQAMLEDLRKGLSDDLEALVVGERRINARQDLERYREEVRALRKEDEDVRGELRRRQAKVAMLTEELDDMTCAVDEVEDKVKDALDVLSDSTRLYKTKTAIRQLKADVKTMEVAIGAKSAAILGKQLELQRAARVTEARKPVVSHWGGLNPPATTGTSALSTPTRSSGLSSKESTPTTAELSVRDRRRDERELGNERSMRKNPEVERTLRYVGAGVISGDLTRDTRRAGARAGGSGQSNVSSSSGSKECGGPGFERGWKADGGDGDGGGGGGGGRGGGGGSGRGWHGAAAAW